MDLMTLITSFLLSASKSGTHFRIFFHEGKSGCFVGLSKFPLQGKGKTGPNVAYKHLKCFRKDFLILSRHNSVLLTGKS